ncbi:uncharacterized protein [Rhodnius prolixus]|uniref:Uncharacterized protein n=1 Tax=Rhodnius prolixus TaxID=13249 RepID=T1H841_RHOPR
MLFYAALIVAHAIYFTDAVAELKGLTKSELLDLEKKTMAECLSKHGIEKSVHTDYLKNQPLDVSKEFKCAIGCYVGEVGYVIDRRTRWSAIEEVHDIEYKSEENKEKAAQVLRICKTIVPEVGEDSCEAGFALYSCYMKEAIKIDLHP